MQMSLFASIMSLHLAFLHAADMSFATLIVWKLEAYAVLNWLFHCPHCQLYPLNWTEMAICSGLRCDSVWNSLYQGSFSGPRQATVARFVLLATKRVELWVTMSLVIWWTSVVSAVLVCDTTSFCTLLSAQYTKSFAAVLMALKYLPNLCRAAVSQIAFICLKTAYL